MNHLKISLVNCYGIGKLDHSFDFTVSNSYLIYSPNGTMKSSLARTFRDIAKNEKKTSPSDRIYDYRETEYDILVDGQPINPESILVIDAEDESYDTSSRITSFIASKELKQQYDDIYSDLDSHKVEFIKKLKNVSQSTDCESEFTNTYSTENPNFFESLGSLIELLESTIPKFSFKYNDIFDKKGNVKKFLDKNQPILDQYLTSYQELLSESKLFKRSENSFGTYQANEIIRSTKDNSFFEAGHKFLLEGNISIESVDSMKALLESEISKIVSDQKLKETFDKVDKAIGANVELRAFKRVIEKDNLLLLELANYEAFRKKVWLSYISELKVEAVKLSMFYSEKKKNLERIIKEAKKEVDTWMSIISKFNTRFYVPFEIRLTNQEDIILKKETANLEFRYHETNEDPVVQNKNDLLNILSKGEQRAYYILQLLFDIEARKRNGSNLLIFDDIADSFDYKNKYAIIEYIKDLHDSSSFKTILLTHNFDFYRTVSSRLNLGEAVYMTSKNEQREITLNRGQYRNNVFKYYIANLDKPKVFISLISFVRNIVEYSRGDNNDYFLKLTDCLHLRDQSESTNASSIFDVYKVILPSCNSKTIDFGDKNIISMIIETAEGIIAEEPINEILLENKIVLSIAVRLTAERFLIDKLPSFDLGTISSNQTRALFEEYSKYHQGNEIAILDKVNLMTPENIHMNAFMYEPLIDMSVHHLISLYQEVKTLS